MRLAWRPRKLGELNPEVLWLAVSLGSFAVAAIWFAVGLPWPRCVFHELTGLPCVTCGMTRCAIQFFHGHFFAALKWNPLVFAFLCGVTAFDLYAFVVLVTRAPRLRICFSTPRAKTFVRMTIISVLLLNWTYLLMHWRNF
jgi:Protein of unknown function (DUF2752)